MIRLTPDYMAKLFAAPRRYSLKQQRSTATMRPGWILDLGTCSEADIQAIEDKLNQRPRIWTSVHHDAFSISPSTVAHFVVESA